MNIKQKTGTVLITLFIMSTAYSQTNTQMETVNIDYIPKYVNMFPALQYPNQVYCLDLNEQCPKNVTKLPKLEKLWFRNCSVSPDILDEINRSSKISELVMLRTKIDTLFFNSLLQEKLSFLSLTFSDINNVESATTAIASLHNIERLFVCDCGFPNFNYEWINLSKLKYLVIGNETEGDYDYETSFKNIAKLESIEELTINTSPLTVLPKTFQSLNKLKALNIFYCNSMGASYIISQIENWKKLEKFGLALDLKTLPNELIKLENLKVLDIADNKNLDIQQALSVISKLENLEELDLSYSINSENDILAPALDDLKKLKKLKKLNFTKNKEFDSKYLWSVLGELTNLEDLNLAGVPGQIFSDIQNLNSLKKLNISWTGPRNMENIEKFPASLEVLNYNTSFLDSFPPQIINTPSLISVNLQYNKIQEVPEEIGKMINLVHLDLSYNQIAILPESIIELRDNLKYLNLMGSPIGKNPIEITKIRKWLPHTEIFEGR